MRIRNVSARRSGRISGHGFKSGAVAFLFNPAHATREDRARHAAVRISATRRPGCARPASDRVRTASTVTAAGILHVGRSARCHPRADYAGANVVVLPAHLAMTRASTTPVGTALTQPLRATAASSGPDPETVSSSHSSTCALDAQRDRLRLARARYPARKTRAASPESGAAPSGRSRRDIPRSAAERNTAMIAATNLARDVPCR